MSLENQEGSGAKQDTLLQEKIQELRGVGDVLGYGIEDGVIEAVAKLNLAGISTNASCEGHVDRALPYPWIRASAPNKPKYRWNGEEELKQEALAEIGAQESDILPGPQHNGIIADRFYKEFYDRLPENIEETPEHQRWAEENRRLTGLFHQLINLFYGEDPNAKDSDAPQIMIDWANFQGVTISAVDRFIQKDEENQTSAPSQETVARLETRRAEMNRFAEFVLEKYKQTT